MSMSPTREVIPCDADRVVQLIVFPAALIFPTGFKVKSPETVTIDEVEILPLALIFVAATGPQMIVFPVALILPAGLSVKSPESVVTLLHFNGFPPEMVTDEVDDNGLSTRSEFANEVMDFVAIPFSVPMDTCKGDAVDSI